MTYFYHLVISDILNNLAIIELVNFCEHEKFSDSSGWEPQIMTIKSSTFGFGFGFHFGSWAPENPLFKDRSEGTGSSTLPEAALRTVLSQRKIQSNCIAWYSTVQSEPLNVALAVGWVKTQKSEVAPVCKSSYQEVFLCPHTILLLCNPRNTLPPSAHLNLKVISQTFSWSLPLAPL